MSTKGNKRISDIPQNGTLPKPVSPPRIPDGHSVQAQPVVVHSPNSQEEDDRIKKYQVSCLLFHKAINYLINLFVHY